MEVEISPRSSVRERSRD
ncbi:unnamed protein product [Cyprideis torosa]|uniref:Uncharacterized protein n=1 Tax=Cyprideis torosa TaxID=163714 RepID=A0A7R9A0C0_9CRUS|nr:unnamed protein product [Cyprideis torosa]CAG0910837.1 unnamed protein product [Cyprideis torosa]